MHEDILFSEQIGPSKMTAGSKSRYAGIANGTDKITSVEKASNPVSTFTVQRDE